MKEKITAQLQPAPQAIILGGAGALAAILKDLDPELKIGNFRSSYDRLRRITRPTIFTWSARGK